MTAVNLSQLTGRRLCGVFYDILEWDDAPICGSVVDEVAKSVTLVFDSLSVALRWDLRPPTERLALLTDERPADPLTRRIDVSTRWEPFVGAKLTGACWAEQETSDGFQPWAVTIGFDTPGEMVVALGELIEGDPTYIPDSLIVTASREAALAYKPAASPTPAWTDPRPADA